MEARQQPQAGELTVILALLLAQAGALAAFEQALDAQPSATRALSEWCAARHIAAPPVIHANPVKGRNARPPADLARLLALDPGAAPGYRHVRLTCGGKVLSEAHNWYVRQWLTPEMNATLDGSDTPFGAVIAPLRFSREPLASVRGAAESCPRGTVLSHRALLRLPDGKPVSLVVECYTKANLKGG